MNRSVVLIVMLGIRAVVAQELTLPMPEKDLTAPHLDSRLARAAQGAAKAASQRSPSVEITDDGRLVVVVVPPPGLESSDIDVRALEALRSDDNPVNDCKIVGCRCGGNVWESNPPSVVLAHRNGFEVREGHQSPIHSLDLHAHQSPDAFPAVSTSSKRRTDPSLRVTPRPSKWLSRGTAYLRVVSASSRKAETSIAPCSRK